MMKYWLRGKGVSVLVFLGITALVTGGLAWVTAAVLRLEQEQLEARAQSEQDALLRPVLWQLDSRIAPILAREDSRPYHAYTAVYAPAVAFRNDGTPYQPGQVILQTPLHSEELPRWMLLHFQTDVEHGWGSPQVLSQTLTKVLQNPAAKAPLDNVTEQREQLRLQLADCLPPLELIDAVKQRCDQQRWVTDRILVPEQNPNTGNLATAPQEEEPGSKDQQMARNTWNRQPQNNFRSLKENNDFYNRQQHIEIQKKEMNKVPQEQAGLAGNWQRNGESWFARGPVRPTPSQRTVVRVGSMVPLWVTPEDGEERLLVARLVQINDRQICQGIVLSWPELQDVLYDVVKETFPAATFQPMREPIPPHPERTMTALPVVMDPGPVPPVEVPTWTPLRIGLALAWTAALVALSAVGLGGASLLALSERRIRFVQAVTHELRTPLTTQRLYLDMLTSGLVNGDQQTDYLRTLYHETDRLHRLVGNVLDFSRLENQRPRLEKTTVAPAEFLEQLRSNWADRCRHAEKELIVENQVPADVRLATDVNLVQQIVGNLIDNACKYSKDALDKRLWLRAFVAGKKLVLEVEDHGPGVARGDRRSIFRPFRRGRNADVSAGGVGLGLALAQRWARLLGGQLQLTQGRKGAGACFQFELPLLT